MSRAATSRQQPDAEPRRSTASRRHKWGDTAKSYGYGIVPLYSPNERPSET